MELMHSRRGFVRLLTGGGILMAGALFEACSAPAPSAPPPPSTSGPPQPTAPSAAGPPATVAPAAIATPRPTVLAGRAAAVKLPTRVPLAGVKPDLPGSADGLIDPGFVNYPASPAKSVAETPGRGGEISVTTWTTSAPPVPMDSNALWQAVNKELGVTLNISIQPQADYATVKLPTIVAGNEMPDILYIATNAVIPQLPTFLKTKMADLTPYLSGDAVKEYPNLANFPTVAWSRVVYGNSIYGVPVPFPQYLWVHWVHQNLLDEEGLSRPKNAAEYKKLAQNLTRPEQSLYGLGVENNVGMGTTNGWLTGIFGAPNIWGLDEKTGKLTETIETEEFRAAVGYARDLWSTGVMHPNGLQYNLISARNDFAARRFAFRFDGFIAASAQFWETAATLEPPGKPRIMSPFPAFDGGKPTYWSSSGILGYSALKKAPPERIKEMLRVLNWLAAPMGSQEYLLMTYGLKDTHWTPDDKGNPVLNARGKQESTVPFFYITRGPGALYYPKDPRYAPIMQDAEKAMLQFHTPNPVDGYYSPANASRFPALARDISDGVNEIVVGRQPLSQLDQVIKQFRDNGGDQIRGEFEREIAAGRA